MSTECYLAHEMPVQPGNAQIRYISKSRYGGDWHSALHTHRCAELFYCLSGQGQFQIGGGRYPVEADDLVFISPQVEHTEQSRDACPLEYIVLGIDGVELEDSAGAYMMLHCRRREEILPLLTLLLQETAAPGAGSEIICRDLLEVLLTRLLRLQRLTLQPMAAGGSSRECAAVYRYIEQHYTEPLTLNQLAAYVHIDKYYLTRSFRQEYGVAPIACLLARRIRESKYLLGNTDYSLSYIAALLGFSSQSYFSQRFRKAESISPNEYRRRAKAGLLPELAADTKQEDRQNG